MSHHPSPTAPPVPCPPVWSTLPSELQQRAVRLLTQLAFARFRHHSQLATQEIYYGPAAQQSQDPSRPS
jgi:hypothetical protein